MTPSKEGIDWRSFLALLYYHGYKGDIVIEPHSRTWQGELLYPGMLFARRFLEPIQEIGVIASEAKQSPSLP